MSASPIPPVRLVMAAHLPPPVTGLSAVNRHVRDSLAAAGRLVACAPLSDGVGAGLRPRWARLRRLGQALAMLTRARSEAEVFYLPVDGGLGQVFNLLLIRRARALGYRLVLHHHSFAYLDAPTPLFAALLRATPEGSLHLVLCEAMGEALDKAAGRPLRWRILGNGLLAPAQAAPPPRSLAGGLVLGHLSNLSRAKGLESVIAVFETLRSAAVEARLVLAGPAAEPGVEALIAAAATRHPDRLTWLGPLDGRAKTDFLHGLDAFLFPSQYRNEAQPLVLIEALAHGAPILAVARGCIACDHGPQVGLIAADRQGFLDQAPAFLTTLAGDPDRRRRLQKACLDAAETARRAAGDQWTALLAELDADAARHPRRSAGEPT